MRLMSRSSLFVVVAVLAGLAAPQRPARADGYCGLATPFDRVASGRLESYEGDDWWQTQSAGTVVVTVDSYPEHVDAGVFAFDGVDCVPLCYFSSSSVEAGRCVVNYTGALVIDVGHYTGGAAIDYTIAVAMLTGPAVGSATPCNLVDVAGVCVDLQPGAVVQEVDVLPGAVPGDPFERVAARVDLYRFNLPGGASATVPCLVAAVGAEVDACAAAGGTFVSTLATLVDTRVTPPGVGDPLVTVRLCDARLSATVAGIGVENVPALTLC